MEGGRWVVGGLLGNVTCCKRQGKSQARNHLPKLVDPFSCDSGVLGGGCCMRNDQGYRQCCCGRLHPTHEQKQAKSHWPAPPRPACCRLVDDAARVGLELPRGRPCVGGCGWTGGRVETGATGARKPRIHPRRMNARWPCLAERGNNQRSDSTKRAGNINVN